MRNGKNLILFAEDDDDTRRMLMYLAQRMLGLEVVGANTASDMVQVFNEVVASGDMVDLIVADVQFHHPGNGPRVTGITAVDSIRKQHPNVSVLYYSAFISSLNKTLIRAQGASFLQKPGTMPHLIERIEYALEYSGPDYSGPERRKTSINHAGYTRRSTDRPTATEPVELPKRVAAAIQQARVNTGDRLAEWAAKGG